MNSEFSLRAHQVVVTLKRGMSWSSCENGFDCDVEEPASQIARQSFRGPLVLVA
jgi:hypothetical protein